jgi:hypothetical protein
MTLELENNCLLPLKGSTVNLVFKQIREFLLYFNNKEIGVSYYELKIILHMQTRLTVKYHDYPTEYFELSELSYGLDNQGGRGSPSPGRVKNFQFSISSRPALGFTQPPIKCVPGVRRQGREADHSPPSSSEVKKMWIDTSTPLYVFMA